MDRFSPRLTLKEGNEGDTTLLLRLVLLLFTTAEMLPPNCPPPETRDEVRLEVEVELEWTGLEVEVVEVVEVVGTDPGGQKRPSKSIIG